MIETTDTTSSTVGTILREQRQKQKLSISTISEQLKIREHVLENIENETYPNNVIDIYYQGHFRTYCKHLKLDHAKLFSQLAESGHNLNSKLFSQSLINRELNLSYVYTSSIIKKSGIVFIITMLIIGIYLFWLSLPESGKHTNQQITNSIITSSSTTLSSTQEKQNKIRTNNLNSTLATNILDTNNKENLPTDDMTDQPTPKQITANKKTKKKKIQLDLDTRLLIDN